MKDCYLAEVISVSRLSPCMIRIGLGGPAMARFHSSGWPDEWVRLIFPAENGFVTLPCLTDGRWQMPSDKPRSAMRPYTVRRWNEAEGTILVDFVVHEGGIASDWAAVATCGDLIGVTSPYGKYEPPLDAQWILLIADATGLPATLRILEEMPTTLAVHAHLEIPTAADIPHDLPHRFNPTWHFGFGDAQQATRLQDIAATVNLPEGDGYIWVAGEAKEVTAIRRYFLDEVAMPKDRITAIGYWTRGKPRD